MNSPIQLRSQVQLNKARRALTLCYLCGKDLPPRGLGFKRLVTAEHVIPRALLAKPPEHPADRWPIVLDVHAKCERDLKQRKDQWIEIIQKLHTRPDDDLPESRYVRSVPIQTEWLHNVPGSPLPAITGFDKILKAFETWVRGLHAVLYREYLRGPIHALPPAPVSHFEEGHQSLQHFGRLSFFIREMVEAGELDGTWDGIDAWGGMVRYRAVWYSLQNDDRRRYVCNWTLTYPGVEEWRCAIFS